jgi:hypothetical protein
MNDMSQIELTEEELRVVAGGQTNHGQATSDAVHFAQDFVYKYQGTPAGGLMGKEVSYFARNGLLPSG